MNCRHITHRVTFSTLFAALILFAMTATAKPFADPMPPDLLCKNTGGTWNNCGSGCGPATCANPQPGPICPAVCVTLCECPAASPLWDTAQGCVPHDVCATMVGDGDGDGYTAADGDCDDNDSSISPAATETCDDGTDNDCNGLIDDGACSGWAAEKELCAQSSGTWTECSTYCYPATCESAQLVECDALCMPMCLCPKGTPLWDTEKGCISEDECNSSNPPPIDNDLDGFTVAQGDCDDNNVAIHPFAAEECDGIDNNCNGLVDDGCESSEITLCNDTGGEWKECGDVLEVPTCQNKNANTSDKIACLSACACPVEKPLWDTIKGCISEDQCPAEGDDQDGDGYTADTDDCNDTDPMIHPGATEKCDLVDNDCDGLVDEEDGCETEEPANITLCKTTGGEWHECGDACGTPTCTNPAPDTSQCAAAGCGPTCKCPESAPLWDPEMGCVSAEACPSSGNEGENDTSGGDGDTTGSDDSKGGVSPISSGNDDTNDNKDDTGCRSATSSPSSSLPLWFGAIVAFVALRRIRARV
ncbi:MAG: hypothetical protein HUU55_00890 [Myxococcales bacterium]|nr:hypothetical protein [Myxococcales bacterium]